MQSEVISNVLATLAQVMDKLGKPVLSDTNIRGASAELRNLADYLTDSLQANDDAPAEGEWITIEIPILDGGGGTIRTFDVLAVSDPEDCHLRGMSLYDSEISADAAINVLRGWRHVLDGNGNPIEFSRDNLAAMFLSWPLLGSRIAKAIRKHIDKESHAYGE